MKMSPKRKIVVKNNLENKVEKVTFDSNKFGDVVLRSVGKNVGNVKLGMHESS